MESDAATTRSGCMAPSESGHKNGARTTSAADTPQTSLDHCPIGSLGDL